MLLLVCYAMLIRNAMYAVCYYMLCRMCGYIRVRSANLGFYPVLITSIVPTSPRTRRPELTRGVA